MGEGISILIAVMLFIIAGLFGLFVGELQDHGKTKKDAVKRGYAIYDENREFKWLNKGKGAE